MKKKYHLVKWCKIAKPKQKGGLGIHDLRKMNLSLLCKWWWKLKWKNVKDYGKKIWRKNMLNKIVSPN